MNLHRKALCWAAATCTAALAGQQGWIDHASAVTLTLALPIIGWTTLTGRNRCLRKER
ncbi:MAG: hypothetical protein WA842_04605 [Croceibacterium sp.]